MTTEEKPGLEAIGEVPVCAKCGSERVVTDAWACWNRETGLWELETSFDDAYCHECEGETRLQWVRPEQPPNRLVRDLNDAFRSRGLVRGSIMATEGVSALGADFVADAVAAVRRFDAFTDDNDPWGEHDFGAIDLHDQKVFWKIDPYDLDLQAHSPNAANPAVTHRVLTNHAGQRILIFHRLLRGAVFYCIGSVSTEKTRVRCPSSINRMKALWFGRLIRSPAVTRSRSL